MSTNSITHIQAIALTGADVAKLLQGQTSCDVNLVNEKQAVVGTLNNAKGRCYASFLLCKTDEAWFMLLHKSIVTSTLANLKKYALFYKVDLSVSEQAFSVQTGSSNDLSISTDNGQTIINWLNGYQIVFASGNEDATDDFIAADLTAGWHWVNEHTQLEYTAMNLNFDLLHAINFQKGCYTGQEIIARSHYKGKQKKRLQLIELADNTTSASELYNSEGKKIGDIVEQQGSLALALLPVAEQDAIYLDNNSHIAATLKNLPYTVDKDEK